MTDRLSTTVSALTRVLITPSSNLRVAYLLYGTLVVLLLLILVGGILVIMRGPDDESCNKADLRAARRTQRAILRLSTRARILIGLITVVALASVWMLAGYTTSRADLCKSCHWPSAQHASVDPATDPHADVRCVSCHEQGNELTQYTLGTPRRIIHLAESLADRDNDSGYGVVTRRTCSACHEGEYASGTTTLTPVMQRRPSQPNPSSLQPAP